MFGNKKPLDELMELALDPNIQAVIQTIVAMPTEEQKSFITSFVKEQLGEDLPKVEAIVDLAPAVISVGVDLAGNAAKLLNSFLNSVDGDDNFNALSGTMQKSIAETAKGRYQAFIEAGFTDSDAIQLTAAYATFNPIAGLNKRR